MAASPEEKFLQLAASLERIILYFLLGTFFLVITVQFVLSYPQPRHWLYARFGDSLEPLPVMAVREAGEETAQIKLKILGHQALRHAYVLVGQKRITNFSEAEIEIIVNKDDEIVIDGSFYNRPLTFQVTGVSPGVLSPILGQEVTTWGSRESLGTVRLSQNS